MFYAALFQLSDPTLHSLGPVICPPFMDNLVGDPSRPTQVSREGTLHCTLPRPPGEGQVAGAGGGGRASRHPGQEGKMVIQPPNLVMVVPVPTMSSPTLDLL